MNMISQSFRHLFHTVLQSEDDLYSVLSMDHLYDTLKAVCNRGDWGLVLVCLKPKSVVAGVQ